VQTQTFTQFLATNHTILQIQGQNKMVLLVQANCAQQSEYKRS
jgi:hypothetical protein